MLVRSKPIPLLRAPLKVVVEAKKQDIDGGLGQCIARMVAAAVYDEREGSPRETLFGCVTTGQDRQFLGLARSVVTLHRSRYFPSELPRILGAFRDCAA